MGKARKKKQDTRGPLQRILDADLVANDQSVLAVITDEQRAKGTYQGERRIVNHHDPVMRWRASGRLSDSQQRSIDHVRRLWELAGLQQRVTATYEARSSGGSSVEHNAHLKIDAREDLHRIKGYFSGVLSPYFDIFENVCRWGEPAGVAGSSLGFGTRSAQDRAHTIVCFVADYVAMKEGV